MIPILKIRPWERKKRKRKKSKEQTKKYDGGGWSAKLQGDKE